MSGRPVTPSRHTHPQTYHRTHRSLRRAAALLGAFALATGGLAVGGLAHPPRAAASPGCGDLPSWDFDQDGTADLAIGAPLSADHGEVQLRITHEGQHQHQAITAPAGAIGFGGALASVSSNEADSDTTFCTQLAVGAPRETVNGHAEAGAVYLYRWNGTKMALRARYVQGQNGVPGTPQTGGHFGAALAAQPLVPGSDSALPLYVGAPGQNVGYATGAGSVTELTIHDTADAHADGSVTTLLTTGIPGQPTNGGALGASLSTAGGVVAAGAPGQAIDGRPGAGAVLTFVRRATGIAAPRLLTQSTAGVPGAVEENDRFGSSVSTVVLNNANQTVETLVGVPDEDIGTVANAGMAMSFRTNAATGAIGTFRGFQQGSGGVGGAPEAGDQFGFSVSDQQSGPDGAPLRLVGVPGEDVGSVRDAGGVNQVGAASNKSWVEGSGSVTGTPETGDQMGWSVSGTAKLIAGVPGENGYGMTYTPWGYVGPLHPDPGARFGAIVH